MSISKSAASWIKIVCEGSHKEASLEETDTSFRGHVQAGREQAGVTAALPSPGAFHTDVSGHSASQGWSRNNLYNHGGGIVCQHLSFMWVETRDFTLSSDDEPRGLAV